MSKNKQHRFLTDYHRIVPVGNEIQPSEVKPGNIYTVLYKIRKKHVDEFHFKLQNQWGIFETNMQNQMIRNYNLRIHDGWAKGMCKLPASAHIFKADWRDAYFATVSGETVNLDGRYRRLQKSYDEAKLQLNRLKANPLIRLISKFLK